MWKLHGPSLDHTSAANQRHRWLIPSWPFVGPEECRQRQPFWYICGVGPTIIVYWEWPWPIRNPDFKFIGVSVVNSTKIVLNIPRIADMFTRTWLRCIQVFAVANLSVCHLSVTFVCIYSGGLTCRQHFFATLATLWPPCKILQRSSQGNPSLIALNARGVAEYSEQFCSFAHCVLLWRYETLIFDPLHSKLATLRIDKYSMRWQR